ncbi:Nuclear factor related to kappa-B-binding protein [Macleaya cordata]|uniref:Nuclear factor related to kappa-B-binding protein n=1 Tax=Macleaya cordata TaxID=56857 RepID=A0A200Q1B9_MACCD|nr:Nuclear factor related to kappa-B-binding protein [Macleaya cordata]
MGIFKIDSRTLGDGSYSGNSSFSPCVGSTEREEKTVSGADSGNESDDQELADVGCELSMVGGQLCSIPYELYDLPDLKEILSLETWNSCLTDEERFSLSAYLPDMDQQTFWLTMKELLGGNVIFFGSPLKELFDRLKGGIYPPKVTHFREGVTFLQRRAYYHSLGLYHENMVRMFGDMKRLWDQCQSNISIEERVHIWKSRKTHKCMDPLDLNAFPLTEDLLGKGVNKKAVMIPVSRKMKHINMESEEEKVHILPPPVANGMKLVAPKTSGKGVLKIKAPGTNTFQTHVPKSMPSDSWVPSRPQPKGVLKIVPKVPPARLEPAQLAEAPGLQTSRYSPLPPSMYKWDENGEDSPLLYQTVVGREAYRSPEQPNYIMDQQRVEFRNGTNGLSRNFQKAIRMNKQAEDRSFDAFTNLQEQNLSEGNRGTWTSDDYHPKGGSGSSSLKVRRYARGRQNDWQNLVCENRELSRSSLEPYPVVAEYYQGEQHMVPMPEKIVPTYPRISDAVSGLSDGTGEHEMFSASFDRIKRHRDVNVGGSQKLHDSTAVSDGLRDGLFLPVTYKRRKGQAKLNKLDFVKPLTVETDYKARMPKETNNQVESAKAIKIRFKK